MTGQPSGRTGILNPVREVAALNRSGLAVALPSICSSHPDVLFAAALLAVEDGSPLLVEATSNQVNQFGGYTGMQPADFASYAMAIAARAGLDRSQLILGGDHLGPQVWRNEPQSDAMGHAVTLVRRFVEAGFTKIHLDCSEGCLGEPIQVGDEVSAERTARLLAACEESAPEAAALTYVVGTEVPPPGGARLHEAEAGIAPTSADSARQTLSALKARIESEVSADAWSRVVGLVVQPGLEFSGDDVFRFDRNGHDGLSPVLDEYGHLVFEAHSTDYQDAAIYPELARRHFAILKVGPALTFAYRQAAYALDHMSAWCSKGGTRLPDVMERLMLARPANWAKHYEGEPNEVRLLRHFGYADRIRYYWNLPEAGTAVDALMRSLEERAFPETLASQYFPPSVIARSNRLLGNDISWPRALVLAQIQEALIPYFACSARLPLARVACGTPCK